MKMKQCPETSERKIQTAEYHPKKEYDSEIRRKFEIKSILCRRQIFANPWCKRVPIKVSPLIITVFMSEH